MDIKVQEGRLTMKKTVVMEKKWRKRVVCAVVLALALLFISPLGARVCFSARIYAASLTADDSGDYITDNGERLVFQRRDTLRTLSKMAFTGTYQDVTDWDLSTWPLPLYYAGAWEIGGNHQLLCRHIGRGYLISPGDPAAYETFRRQIHVAEQNVWDTIV